MESIVTTIQSVMASFSQVDLQNGLHSAAALAALTLLITSHRAISNLGFTLRRRGPSTDLKIVGVIGVITVIWTALVVISAVFLDDTPCRVGFEQCAARLSYVPWILNTLLAFWIVAYADQIAYLRRKERAALRVTRKKESSSGGSSSGSNETGAKDGEGMGVQADPEAQSRRDAARAWWNRMPRLPWPGRMGIWHMECDHGPLNWSGSISKPYLWTVYAAMMGVTLTVAIPAIKQQQYTVGLLVIVGVLLFIVGASGANKYADTPHNYTYDTLRVMLHTRHKAGTSYILPCRDRGFDAVWGPKINAENKAIDEAIDQFLEKGGYSAGQVVQMNVVLAGFNSSTDLTAQDVNDLARWLYDPESSPDMCRIVCKRADNIHLVSLAVATALWHAEYIVFQNLGRVDPALRDRWPLLRSTRLSGISPSSSNKGPGQIGSRGGIEGYQDTVRYLYRLLGEEPDASALEPTSKCPATSCVLDPCPTDMRTYVGKLWDYCFREGDSTFAALMAFTTHWMGDVGNDAANGWHSMPLRAVDREGDIVTWHIIWRQAWYGAVISQLTSMSPIILSAFLSGALQ